MRFGNFRRRCLHVRLVRNEQNDALGRTKKNYDDKRVSYSKPNFNYLSIRIEVSRSKFHLLTS